MVTSISNKGVSIVTNFPQLMKVSFNRNMNNLTNSSLKFNTNIMVWLKYAIQWMEMELFFNEIDGCATISYCLLLWQFYISQAALKNSRESKDGVDKEITFLQTEVEVITSIFKNILNTSYHLCFNHLLSNSMQK